MKSFSLELYFLLKYGIKNISKRKRVIQKIQQGVEQHTSQYKKIIEVEETDHKY